MTFVTLPKAAGVVMEREQATTYELEVRGDRRQVLITVTTVPGKSPWWSDGGYHDAVVVTMLAYVLAQASVEQASKGHVTRGTLHFKVNLTEGADRSLAVDDIRQIVAAFFNG